MALLVHLAVEVAGLILNLLSHHVNFSLSFGILHHEELRDAVSHLLGEFGLQNFFLDMHELGRLADDRHRVLISTGGGGTWQIG